MYKVHFGFSFIMPIETKCTKKYNLFIKFNTYYTNKYKTLISNNKALYAIITMKVRYGDGMLLIKKLRIL